MTKGNRTNIFHRAAKSTRDSDSSALSFALTVDYAHDMIAAEYPEFADMKCRQVSGGQIAQTFMIGDTYFKFPRTKEELLGLDREWAVLAILQKTDLCVPRALVIGKKTVFYGMKEVEGEMLRDCVEHLGARELTDIGKALAGTMIGIAKTFSALPHAFPLPEPDKKYRLNPTERLPDPDAQGLDKAMRALEGIESLSADERRLCADALKAYGERAAHAAPVFCHADLNQGNIIVKDGKLAGVIDFGCMAWDRIERACHWISMSHEKALAQSVSQTLLSSTDPFVTREMKRDIAAYALYADITAVQNNKMAKNVFINALRDTVPRLIATEKGEPYVPAAPSRHGGPSPWR